MRGSEEEYGEGGQGREETEHSVFAKAPRGQGGLFCGSLYFSRFDPICSKFKSPEKWKVTCRGSRTRRSRHPSRIFLGLFSCAFVRSQLWMLKRWHSKSEQQMEATVQRPRTITENLMSMRSAKTLGTIFKTPPEAEVGPGEKKVQRKSEVVVKMSSQQLLCTMNFLDTCNGVVLENVVPQKLQTLPGNPGAVVEQCVSIPRNKRH